jgi:hypothetical protein
MSNTLNDDKSKITKLLDDDKMYELSIYHILPLFFEKFKNIKIILYYRQDSSQFTDYLLNLLIKFPNLFIMKDFLTKYNNTVKLYDSCVNILNNNDDLHQFFDIKKFNFKSTNELIPNNVKNKILIFTIYPLQYSFFNLNKVPIINFDDPIKKYDVFFCKHQRITYDGIGRKYVLDNIMPSISSKINNVVYFEKLNKLDYTNYFKESKISISPYGMGEWVLDDSIGPLTNTIIVKPKCDEVYDYFNIFTDDNFNNTHHKRFDNCIVYCKPDYSDLFDVISKILNNYDFYFEKMKIVKKQYYDFLQSDMWEKDFQKIINYVNTKS